MAEHNGNGTALSDRSVADLLKQLSDQTATLVRQELELAKVELTAKGKRAGIGAGLFGAAGMLGFYAFGALVACAILALGLVLAGWLAALIVAAVVGGAAGALALSGKGQISKGVPPVPEQTVATVNEDVQVVKQRVRAGRR